MRVNSYFGLFGLFGLLLIFVIFGGHVNCNPRNGFTFDVGHRKQQYPDPNRMTVQAPVKPRLYCPPGQELVRKPEGLACMKDLSYLWRPQQKHQQNYMNNYHVTARPTQPPPGKLTTARF
jgi:hypothetical protein